MSFRHDLRSLPKQRQIIIEKTNQNSNNSFASKNKQDNVKKDASEETVYTMMNVNQEYLVVDITKELCIEKNDAKYYLEEFSKKRVSEKWKIY